MEPIAGRASSDDAGAAIAKRTVAYRKPRQEVFPLVGSSADALRARREMLVELARSADAPSRARLLLACAEISQQLGDRIGSSDALVEAYEADPKDLAVMRALRRDALARRDFSLMARILTDEAALPLAAEERALALTHLAEIQLSYLGDPIGAERSAKSALTLRRHSVVAALLLAEASMKLGKAAEASVALERAATSWTDASAQAVLLSEVGRATEAAGHTRRAAQVYGRAIEADAQAFDAYLGAARTSWALNDRRGAASLLKIASELLEGESSRAVFCRAAAAMALASPEGAPLALEALRGAKGAGALAMRAEAARRVGDHDERAVALLQWAQVAGGGERAWALTTLAEALAEGGKVREADQALRDASLADNTLSAIRAVREVLGRRIGQPDLLPFGMTETSTDTSPLVEAARFAAPTKSGQGLEQEQLLLGRALRKDESPALADVIALDAAAEAGDLTAVQLGLQRQADRVAPSHRAGPMVTLADMALREGDRHSAVRMLQEARHLAHGAPLVTRPLAALLERSAPLEAASLWLEEADACSGDRAAYAATRAGRITASVHGEAAELFLRALEADAAYAPSIWALEDFVRASGEKEPLVEAYQLFAEAASDDSLRFNALVRLALLLDKSDPQGADEARGRALGLRPGDSMLALSLALSSTAVDSHSLAKSLAAAAHGITGARARTLRLRAASLYERSGELARATELYRDVSREYADDPIARRGLDRTEIALERLSGVAQRLFEAVRRSEGKAKQDAFRALTEYHLYERGDVRSAALSLRSLLEVDPTDLVALVALERISMEAGDRKELLRIEEKLCATLSHPSDIDAHSRFAVRLRLASMDASGGAGDDLLLAAFDAGASSPWLLRRVEGAALERGSNELRARALLALAEDAPEMDERAALTLQAAEALARSGEANEALQRVQSLAGAQASHPYVLESLAWHLLRVGRHAEAVKAFSSAAQDAQAPGRGALLWSMAGSLLADHLEDLDGARAALEEAARRDLSAPGVFERLRRFYGDARETAKLAELIERRLALGAEPALELELHLAQAEVCSHLADSEGTLRALQKALAIAPTNEEALRRSAEEAMALGRWSHAAEILVDYGRLQKDRERLRWVFMTLGEIYDTHLPDLRRAEVAYRRVLQLAPNDVQAIERLALVLHRDDQIEPAIAAMRQLIHHLTDVGARRVRRFTLSKWIEESGDLKGAESELEHARREDPTSHAVIAALASFYDRIGESTSKAVHLERAAGDYRRALEGDFTRPRLWVGMMTTLVELGRSDAARCAASAAIALGVDDETLRSCTDARGVVPGGGRAAADASLDELMAPEAIDTATRTFFRLAQETLEAMLPFDLKQWRAEKLGGRDPYRKQASALGESFGLSDVRVFVTSAAPRVCVPVATQPPTILVGNELLRTLEEPEREFLFVRALKILVTHLCPAIRCQPEELRAAIGGIIHTFDLSFDLPGVDSTTLAEMARRAQKQIPRKVRSELASVAIEVGRSKTFDPSILGVAAAELGNRAALLYTGDAPAGVGALLALGQAETLERQERAAMIHAMPEPLALIRFALSDVHFDLRQRVGADGL